MLVVIGAVFGATAVTGLASLLWTRVMVWPTERKRLEAAERVRRLDQVPSGRDYAATQLVMLVVGGLCVAATLWAVASYLGFVGAPMLWSAVGIANLEKARQLQRLERAHNVIYYQAPRTTPVDIVPPGPVRLARWSLPICWPVGCWRRSPALHR